MANRSQPRVLQALFLAGAGILLAAGRQRPKRPLLWSVLSFVADLIAIPAILRAKPPISDAELNDLDRQSVPALDRIALELPVDRRAAIQKRSDAILQATVALPLLLLLQPGLRRTFPRWAPDYVWGHALTYTLYTFGPFGPAFVDKYRPVVYRHEVPLAERRKGNNRNSHYSGHTGSAAFAGVFLAMKLRQQHACSPWLVVPLAIVPPALVGSLRVRAQKHFPSDVLLATAIGALFAILLAHEIDNGSVIRD